MIIQRVGYYSGIIHCSGVIQVENGEKRGDAINLRYFFGVEIRLGGLNVEGKGEEIAKNESCVQLGYLNGQKCHSLE